MLAFANCQQRHVVARAQRGGKVLTCWRGRQHLMTGGGLTAERESTFNCKQQGLVAGRNEKGLVARARP